MMENTFVISRVALLFFLLASGEKKLPDKWKYVGILSGSKRVDKVHISGAHHRGVSLVSG